MNHFPTDINRSDCVKVLCKNQTSILQQTREQFTNRIREALADSQKEVELVFDNRLWDEGKTTVVKEIIDLFGEVNITSNPTKDHKGSTKPVSSIVDITNNIHKITIIFLY